MDEKDVERLLDKFDKSSLKDFEYSDGKAKLSFSKRSENTKTVVNETRAQAPVAQPVVKPAVKPAETTKKTAPVADNLTPVKAPLVGIVYMAPSPDKPVFKSVGDHVNKGEVVCLIEAMKMVNEVKSKVSGTIEKVLVKDGDMVQYDQPIFKIAEE